MHEDKAYSSRANWHYLRRRGIKATIAEPADQAHAPGTLTTGTNTTSGGGSNGNLNAGNANRDRPE